MPSWERLLLRRQWLPNLRRRFSPSRRGLARDVAERPVLKSAMCGTQELYAHRRLPKPLSLRPFASLLLSLAAQKTEQQPLKEEHRSSLLHRIDVDQTYRLKWVYGPTPWTQGSYQARI